MSHHTRLTLKSTPHPTKNTTKTAPQTGEESELKVPAALAKIDVSGILFFFGILLSVGALDSAGILQVRGGGGWSIRFHHHHTPIQHL